MSICREAGQRYGRSRVAAIGLASTLVASAVACTPGTARAYDFVEHAVLTVEGARGLPAPARAALGRTLVTLRAPRQGGEAGLPLCEDPLVDLAAATRRDCRPYGALPSLAADHYPTEDELLAALDGAGALISGGASSQERLEKNLATIDPDEEGAVAQARSDALRAHDLYQTVQHGWFSDRGYVELTTRGLSHFQAADRSIERQLGDLVAEGRIDRALGQAIVHHLRSLQLASSWRRTGRRWELARALAAHGFALHFAQDAHAAGHAVTTEAQFVDADGRMRRHDYFGFRGVGLTFALAEGPCSARATTTFHETAPLSPCWTAFGDGNLGEVGAPDRQRAVEVSRLLQLQLAMALDPSMVEQWSEAEACPAGQVGGEPAALCAPPPADLAAAAELLDPHPTWTFPSGFIEPRGARGCSRAALVVASAAGAIARLDGTHRIPAITSDAPDDRAGVTPVRGVVTADEIGSPLDRCVLPSLKVHGDAVDPAVDPLCRGAGIARARLGSPAQSLLRPLLARWPVTQATAATLVGEAGNGRGWGWQITIGAQTATTLEGQSAAFAFGAFGVSPRFQDLFPQESSFAPVELNAGLGPTLLLPHGRVGAAVFAELRLPLVALVTPAVIDLVTEEVAPAFITEIAIIPHGVRLAYDVEREALRWDLEMLSAHVPLGSTFLPHRADLRPADLRLRMGRDHGLDAWAFALELVGGATGMFGGAE